MHKYVIGDPPINVDVARTASSSTVIQWLDRISLVESTYPSIMRAAASSTCSHQSKQTHCSQEVENE